MLWDLIQQGQISDQRNALAEIAQQLTTLQEFVELLAQDLGALESELEEKGLIDKL